MEVSEFKGSYLVVPFGINILLSPNAMEIFMLIYKSTGELLGEKPVMLSSASIEKVCNLKKFAVKTGVDELIDLGIINKSGSRRTTPEYSINWNEIKYVCEAFYGLSYDGYVKIRELSFMGNSFIPVSKIDSEEIEKIKEMFGFRNESTPMTSVAKHTTTLITGVDGFATPMNSVEGSSTPVTSVDDNASTPTISVDGHKTTPVISVEHQTTPMNSVEDLGDVFDKGGDENKNSIYANEQRSLRKSTPMTSVEDGPSTPVTGYSILKKEINKEKIKYNASCIIKGGKTIEEEKNENVQDNSKNILLNSSENSLEKIFKNSSEQSSENSIRDLERSRADQKYNKVSEKEFENIMLYPKDHEEDFEILIREVWNTLQSSPEETTGITDPTEILKVLDEDELPVSIFYDTILQPIYDDLIQSDKEFKLTPKEASDIFQFKINIDLSGTKLFKLDSRELRNIQSPVTEKISKREEHMLNKRYLEIIQEVGNGDVQNLTDLEYACFLLLNKYQNGEVVMKYLYDDFIDSTVTESNVPADILRSLFDFKWINKKVSLYYHNISANKIMEWNENNDKGEHIVQEKFKAEK